MKERKRNFPSCQTNVKACSLSSFTKLLLSCACFAITISLVSCKTNQSIAYHSMDTTAISSGMDGSLVVRVQGKGVSQSEAYLNARKKAVHDVIFSIIHESYGEHKNILPLINDPSIEKKNEAFFNKFFSDEGQFKEFIGKTDEDKQTFSYSTSHTVIINVLVYRSAVKDYLNSNL